MWLERESNRAVVLFCSAQAFPVPVFRLDLRIFMFLF